jgi:hypothetical protein
MVKPDELIRIPACLEKSGVSRHPSEKHVAKFLMARKTMERSKTLVVMPLPNDDQASKKSARNFSQSLWHAL